MALVQEASQPGMTISYVARRHGIAASLIFGWRRRMSEGGKEAIRADDEVVSKAEILALQKQVRELQRCWAKRPLRTRSCARQLKSRTKKMYDPPRVCKDRLKICGKSVCQNVSGLFLRRVLSLALMELRARVAS